MQKLLALLAVALMLPGCLGDDDTPDTTNTDTTTTGTTDEGRDTQVFNGTGVVDRAAGTIAGSIAQGTGGEFTIHPNATLIFAEMAWEDTTFDLDLGLDSPDGPDESGQDFFEHTAEGGAPGAGDSPHSLTLTPGDTTDWEGAWRLTAFANGAAVDVDYSWAVTVFYGETSVPEGYTAL